MILTNQEYGDYKTMIKMLADQLTSRLSNKELVKTNNYLTYMKSESDYSVFDTEVKKIAADVINAIDSEGIPKSVNDLSYTYNKYPWNILTSEYNWKAIQTAEDELIKQYEFLKAYELRKLWYEILALKYINEGYYCFETIWALQEKRLQKETEEVCNQILNRLKYNLNKDKLIYLMYLFQGENKEFAKLGKIYDIGIVNRDVIIRGPLAEPIYQQKSDAQKNVVIEIGNKGKTKCDISFYNGEAAKVIKNDNNRGFFDFISCNVFFKIKYLYQIILYMKRKAKKVYSIDFLFIHGQPNMLQNLLYHVFRNCPASVYITGFNLYYSSVVYGGEYKMNSGIENVKANFSKHNLISQFLFTKMLYERKLFECDDKLKNVLNLDITDYLQGMELLCKE